MGGFHDSMEEIVAEERKRRIRKRNTLIGTVLAFLFPAIGIILVILLLI